ncbi:MAG TPA: ABC transporter ATP-binding protein [Solirubrobacteraceae bacterium]|nr:ABC transporter ATP-binding protein [Solirubrobacteraceae bacterium]
MNTADTAHSEGPSAYAQAAELELRGVSKRYPGQREPAIGELSFTVPAGEVCVLVGPSGSGKTTAMRLINRMIPITAGDILLGGRSVLEREPRELRREIGYVIQQIGLFPHQTVDENIATVPRLLGWPKERIRARVRELLELIDLDPAEMEGRYPAQLSGGQRQRVGVARALAADPPLMLMDEPFGAIDPINRSRLQDEFLRLQEKVKKTVVFVTHDIDEAIKMGDRIAILREGGVLAQYDTPREILTHPADDFVAQFVGEDRGLKRLALTTLGELELLEPDATHREALANGALRLPRDTTVRNALSLMLTAKGEPVAVLDGDGGVEGLVTLQAIEQLLSDEAATPPDAAAPATGAAAPVPDGATPAPDGATSAAAEPGTGAAR